MAEKEEMIKKLNKGWFGFDVILDCEILWYLSLITIGKNQISSSVSSPTIFDLTPIEEQHLMDEYHQLFGTFEDYLGEMVVG